MGAVCDLILIRHEEAEGNAAMVRSKFSGDDSKFTEILRTTPSNDWRLTDFGKERCVKLRGWIMNNVPLANGFRFVTSPSMRSIETANLILPEAVWSTEELVRGRTWGGIESIPWSEWPQFCKVKHHNALPSGFLQAYPGGETMAEVWKRTIRFINTLESNTLAITHGEVMLMAQMVIESVPTSQYKPIEMGSNHISNGHVLWYSKQSPLTGICFDHFTFRRLAFDNTDTGWSTFTHS